MALPTDSLRGKACFITGATGGLGRALADNFAAAGCRLFLTGRKEERLAALVDDLRNGPGSRVEVRAEPCDLRDVESLPAILKTAQAAYGTIDILINNAGIFATKPLVETTPELFSEIFEVNVRAAFVMSRLVAEPMIERQWGRIVNIGSSSAYSGFANSSAYCASKHALLGLSRSLYQELKPHNVRVYCFSPGSIKTDMGRQVVGQEYQRFMSPEDVANYVVYAVAFDDAMVTEEVRFNRIADD